MAQQFDAIVVGTGQSGPSLAGRLAAEGLKTHQTELQYRLLLVEAERSRHTED